MQLLRREALDSEDFAGTSAPEREARLFAHVLEHIPIGLEPGETLAGDFGWRFATPAQKHELEQLLSEPHVPPPAGSPTPLQLLDERFHCRAGYTPAHTCADYERVVEEGLDGILTETVAGQAKASGGELATLRAMEVALRAVVGWADRYAGLAREMAASEPDVAERERLAHIARTCERVPRLPATTFHEALQSIWFVHAAIGLSEMSGSSLSLGRLDQYLYPLFQQDRANGIPDDTLEESLRDLWLKLNRFGDPACAVNLGGIGEKGHDLFNPLSAMIVRVTRALRLPSPILAARIHQGLPARAFDLLVDPDLFRLGQPTFYGETPCREALVRRGVPASEAYRFALNSCMGIMMPGEEISDMWGVVANLLLPLELALNSGQPFEGDLPLTFETAPCAAYDSFEDLYDQFARYLDELVAYLVEQNRDSAQRVALEQPNPFLSALTRDCIARGQDRAAGGARYHSVIVEGFGWCNVADAFAAIRRLVFDTRQYSIPELVNAVRADFQGCDEILHDILSCPKYGNADETADAIAQRVTHTFAQVVRRHSQGRLYYLPSYHTLNAHIAAGRKLAASLDGRRAGEPLGKNVGPMIGRSTEGLTALVLSASCLDQKSLSGGQALDISVDPAIVRDREGRRKFQALLLTYFERGGLQIQVNGVTADELRGAIDDPQSHRDLTVKIAGYSARFVTLSRDVQEEMVQRFEQGL